jgi:hypothetical protein
MRFFHVERTSHLKSGEIIEFKATVTGLEDFFGFSRISQHGYSYLFDRPPIKSDPSKSANVNGLCELLFEFVRLQDFPERPSRLQAFFAFQDITDAINFRNKSTIGEYPIWEVEADDHFCADMNLVRFGHKGVDAFANAHKYWSGDGSEQPLWECLLIPPVTVVRQVT